MAALSPEDRQRFRRSRSELAISLAMKNRWDEAARANREILDLFPEDVDTYNRLGKALTELGQYVDARAAYAKAVKLDPANGIATKNLQRLSALGEKAVAPQSTTPVDPRLFIEESGKTTVTLLTDVRRSEGVAKLTAGDGLRLDRRGARVYVIDVAGHEIGRLEPHLEQTILRLLDLGNAYSVFVTSATGTNVSIIIRETRRSAAMGDRPSFRPSAAPEGARAYAREGLLRYDDEELEDDDELEEEEEEEDEAEPDAEPAVAGARAPEEARLEVLAEEEAKESDEAAES